ncbi:MAG: EthD family reductase [Acidobacteriota bacterium]
MIKVSVMYPNSPGGRFDMAYYLESHIPMVREKLGGALKGVSVDQGIAGDEPGSPPPYLALAHLLFDSMEAFGAAFGPHEKAIGADVPNYTNVQPVLQVSEVKL